MEPPRFQTKTMEITITDLTKIATDHKVSQSSASELQAAFMPFFQSAHELAETAKTVKVTNIGQTQEMGRAKEQFRAVQKVLSETEKTRVEYKAESLQRGRAIDGMAHIIKHILEPVKLHLEDQWKYGERLQAKVQAEQRQMREIEAGDLIKYFPAGIDLGAIADEEFARYLHFAGVQAKAIQDENNRIENERIERERKEAAERESLRVENERLRKDAEKQAAKMEAERAAAAKIQAEKDAELAAQRAEVSRLERAERERIASENRAKMEADNAERERLRKEQEAKEAAEKEALNTSDRVKIEAIISEIKKINIPDFAVKGSKQRVFSLIFDLEIDLLKIVE